MTLMDRIWPKFCSGTPFEFPLRTCPSPPPPPPPREESPELSWEARPASLCTVPSPRNGSSSTVFAHLPSAPASPTALLITSNPPSPGDLFKPPDPPPPVTIIRRWPSPSTAPPPPRLWPPLPNPRRLSAAGAPGSCAGLRSIR